jgi:MraZ protein
VGQSGAIYHLNGFLGLFVVDNPFRWPQKRGPVGDIEHMFSGEFEHTLDEKNRIFLPAKYRDKLGETVIVVRGTDGQLNIYPPEAWQRIAENLAGQNQARRAVRDITRILFANSDCPVDKQGRITLTPALRKFANLDTNVVILGVNDHLEIWSPEQWQEVNNRLRTEGSDIAEQLAELGLRL